MAWTSPMTFVSNNVLTAAQLNTHLRDNLKETAPAKATTDTGSWFIAQGPNQIEERIIKVSRVNNQEATKSTSWTDLGKIGPQVTVTTGKAAIVMLGCMLGNTVAEGSASMGFQIKGYTDKDPEDRFSLFTSGRSANTHSIYGVTYHVPDLNPGLNTFTAKYKAGGDTAEFRYRFMGVIPL